MQRSPAAAVPGANQRISGLVHVGVGHDDHVVLGTTKALHAFAVGAASAVDVFGNRCRADKADGLDHVGQDRVNGLFVAIHDLQDALGQARFFISSASIRARWVTLGWLQDEGVAATIAGANIHIGIIAGKLNGVMPARHPSG